MLSVAGFGRVMVPTGRWDYVSEPGTWWEVATASVLATELIAVEGEWHEFHIVGTAGDGGVGAIDPMQGWVLSGSF